jgi:hypothetical protein
VVSVPVATYDGIACPALGTSIPLSPLRLQRLDSTHENYVNRTVDAAREIVPGKEATSAAVRAAELTAVGL